MNNYGPQKAPSFRRGHTIDGKPYTTPNGRNYVSRVVPRQGQSIPATAPYQAIVQLEQNGVIGRNSRGVQLQKDSDMFPDNWSASDIEEAIREAFLNAYDLDRPNGWKGRDFIGTGRGILIIGFVSNDGKTITSAWPMF